MREKRYKAAVIGLGNIGLTYDLDPQRPRPSSHVGAYESSSGFELICGIDEDCEKREMLKAASPGAEFFTSLDSAMASGILDGLDVVSICTPPSSHLHFLSVLLEEGIGKVLFCEKPIVHDLHEAEKLKRLSKPRKETRIVPNISRRWNAGLRGVAEVLKSQEYGAMEKINIRYTRGIYNTGSHLFDLLRMWTGQRLMKVLALNETRTSACPERSYSFYFEQEDGVTGYAEAVDDSGYYLFDIDLYLSGGKIEMRNSGDDIFIYGTGSHHLFGGHRELLLARHETGLLKDACIKNAVDNIFGFLESRERLLCDMEDAIYPLYAAEALERSYRTKTAEVVTI